MTGGLTLAPPRWTARARSVADIERELSRIWRAVAETDTLGSREGAEVGRSVPHLAPLLDEPGDVRVRMRTSVLTLIVVARRPETAERALDAINLLAGRHPSRTVVLAPRDPDGPSGLVADIIAQCHVTAHGGAETCTEQIVVHCSGELDQHLAEVATPLLVHDLPVAVWWPDDPPIGRRSFADLLDLADRILVDTGSFTGDGVERLVALGEIVAGGRTHVCDIGWMRLTPWRELLAGLFDHPLLTPELAAARSLRVDVARPGFSFRISKAALFVGWLADRLGWTLVEPLARRRGGEGLVGAYRHRTRLIRVELRPIASTTDPTARSAGSLQGVEFELGRRGRNVVARVTRQADHLLATADWEGAQVTRRAGRLEPFGEASYLAEALDPRGAATELMRASFAQAVRLVGRDRPRDQPA